MRLRRCALQQGLIRFQLLIAMALLLVTVGAIGRAAASPAVIPAAVLDTVCIPIDIFGVDGNVDTLGFDMKACACGTTLAIAPASSPFCGTTAIA
ncbi:MAG TPA: hypothetical protein VGO93_27900, partial [Candidatus Xenobia bacterium]